jgi:uncharacterized Zn finger protein
VRARVQGSRPEPYDVTIRVTPLTRASWQKVAGVLGGEAVFLAKLLAGEMPPNIEAAFARAALSLFPSRISELQTACSCPDWSNPCKHIAAVYYLLGEEFDRDPFLVFKLRGITRDELLRMVEHLSGDERPREGRRRAGARGRKRAGAATAASFWRPGELPPDQGPEPVAPAHAGALLSRLGPFPFWRGTETVPDALLPVYGSASAAALELLAALTPAAKDEREEKS